ncbi:MAG: twin-arginine translocase TatA/TatE family subunit [Pyrinomonadaceae bacterium]
MTNFLFIFESISTQELIIVGIIAMIFLGPRKLPEIARKIGKLMSEFRSTTNDFKETWRKEVDFETDEKEFPAGETGPNETTARVNSILDKPAEIAAPEVKEVDPDQLEKLKMAAAAELAKPDPGVSDKKNWL